MTNVNIFTSFNLVLKPLTPIHVWSGDRLTVGVDVVVRNGKLCYIDIDKLPEEVVSKIISSLPDDIPKILASSKYIPCKEEIGISKNINLPLGLQINDLNKNIVPASTMKGYIRTAMLFSFLNREGTKKKDVIASTINPEEDPKNLSQPLEAYYFRAPKPRLQGGFLDAFQRLLISDPYVKEARFDVEEFRVYKLPSLDKPIAKQYVVAFKEGTLMYKVKILVKPDSLGIIKPVVREHDMVLKKLSTISHPGEVLSALKEFGCFLLEHEIERVRNVEGLRGYLNMLEKWRITYCKDKKNCVIGRIGYMSGLASKTVIHIVKNVDENLYKAIKSVMEMKLNRVWDELTIKTVELDGTLIGVGWCELCQAQ